jgi:hypothetical protein
MSDPSQQKLLGAMAFVIAFLAAAMCAVPATLSLIWFKERKLYMYGWVYRDKSASMYWVIFILFYVGALLPFSAAIFYQAVKIGWMVYRR